MPDEKKDRDVAVNRRAYHDYFIDEKMEAGIMLTGSEVKSVRNGRTNRPDGFVRDDGKAGWGENRDTPPVPARNPDDPRADAPAQAAAAPQGDLEPYR